MSVSTFLMGSEIQPRKEKWWQVTRRLSCKLTIFLIKTRYNIDSQLSRYAAAKETYSVAERSHTNALQLTELYEQEFQLGQKSLLDLISSRNEAFQAYVSMIDSKYSLYILKLQQLSLIFHLMDYLKGNTESELNVMK